MPPPLYQRTFSDRIAPTSLSQVVDALSHDDAKNKIKSVVEDYVERVAFEELVMKYAGKEIDKRSLGTFRFWATLVSSTIATGVITTLITLALSKNF